MFRALPAVPVNKRSYAAPVTAEFAQHPGLAICTLQPSPVLLQSDRTPAPATCFTCLGGVYANEQTRPAGISGSACHTASDLHAITGADVSRRYQRHNN